MAGGLFDPSELYQALKQREMLPKWAPYVPAASHGVYDFSNNSIIAPDPRKQQADWAKRETTSTLSHEMSHGVQHNLLLPAARAIADKKWNKQTLTPQEEQFLRASETLFATQFAGAFNKEKANADDSSLEKALNALYYGAKGKKPSEDHNKKHDHKTDFDRYRTNARELQAHGVGNMSKGGGNKEDSPSPLHLDPSFATEFSILLEMYKKLPEDLKGVAQTKRQESFSQERQKKPLKSYYEDIFADPFKPTIK